MASSPRKAAAAARGQSPVRSSSRARSKVVNTNTAKVSNVRTASPAKVSKVRTTSPAKVARTPSKARKAGQANLKNSSWWIEESALGRLGEYHYRSEDDSILTRLFLNRFWTWLAQFVPSWLAPNAITLIGLAHVISSFLLSCWYRPALKGPMPAWAYAWMGWSVFAYTTLDALDGKQARRTQSSSPLGELFDHGCDCCNLVLLSFITLGIIDIPLGYASMAAICSAMVGFYVVTWEEYHTGVLYLGHLSGPVEGAMTISCLAFISAAMGAGIWSTPFYNSGWLLGELFIGVTALITGITVLQSFVHVGAKKSLYPTVLQLLPLISTLTLLPWLCKRHPMMLQGSCAFWTLLLAGTIFTNQTSLIIIHHLTKQPYPWFGLAPLTIAPLFCVEPTLNLLMGLALFNTGLFILRFYTVVRQFARHLNIRVLHLK